MRTVGDRRTSGVRSCALTVAILIPSVLYGAELDMTPRILALSGESSGWDATLVATADSGFLALWREEHIDAHTILQNIMYLRTDSFGAPLEGIRALTQYPPRVGVATAASPELAEVQACADHDGNVYVLWNQYWNEPGEPPHYIAESVLAASHDSGESFSTPMNVSGDRLATLPRIACSDDGTVLIAFLDFTPGEFSLTYRISLDHGGSFGAPRSLPRSHAMSTSAERTVFSILADRTIVAAWDAGHVGDSTYDIFTAYSRDGGGTWSEPLNVSDDPQYSQDPAIASTEDGRTVIAWEDARSGVFGIYAKILDARTGRISKKPFRLSRKDPAHVSANDPAIAYHHGVIWSIWSQGGGYPPTYGTARLGARLEFDRRRIREIVHDWGGVAYSQVGVSNDGAVGIVWTGCRVPYCGLAPTPAFLAIVKPPDLRRFP